jgi:hypothetical protein
MILNALLCRWVVYLQALNRRNQVKTYKNIYRVAKEKNSVIVYSKYIRNSTTMDISSQSTKLLSRAEKTSCLLKSWTKGYAN